MRIFLLGATGNTGRALAHQAPARGHAVTTFGRAETNTVRGNPMDAEALAGAMRGHDVVISAIGSRQLNARGVRTASARAVIAAMPRAGMRRLIIMSSMLVGDLQDWRTWLFSRTLLRSQTNDQHSMEAVVRASDIDWTIVRPPTLTNGPLTGRGENVDHEIAGGRLSRADTAKLMLDIAESGAYVRKIVWMR